MVVSVTMRRRSNPYTSPWTVIEYRITRRLIDGIVYLVLLELVQEPGEKPTTAVYTWHASRADLIKTAKFTIQNAARRERNSPIPVRLFDERGQCLYAARNKMMPPSHDPKWGLIGQRPTPSWEEIPCDARPNPHASRKQNPIYFDDLPLAERQRHAQLWRASIAKLRDLPYPFQATFDGERITVLGRVRDFEPYTSHPCQQAEATDESMMVRGSDGKKFIVFGHSLFVGDQRLVYQSGYRRRPVVDPLGLGWKENPVGVFIYDLDALDKLAAMEGQDWLKDDRRMWERYRSGNTAHAFVTAWKFTRHLSPEDSIYWKDYFAGETGVELGVIYGNGGYARYAVSSEGEIRLDPGSTRPEKVARALGLGFRVPR